MDVYQIDPFQRPYWRHERVLALRQSVPPQRCRRWDDKWIQQYRSFLIEWDKGGIARNRLLHLNPGLYYAHKIQEMRAVEPDVALIVEARLLAGMSYSEIAENVKTTSSAIEWYEKLFFNVSDKLKHCDWIVKSILLPAYDQYVTREEEVKVGRANHVKTVMRVTREIARPHLDMTLKFFAYYGGPLVCDVMISGFRRHPHVRNPEEISEYFNQQFAMHIQRRSVQAAMTFEVNKYNVIDLFAAHTKLLEIQKSTKDEAAGRAESLKNVGAFFEEINYVSGRLADKSYEGTVIGKYDSSAAEVSSEEAIEAGLGYNIKSMDELQGKNIFADRKGGR